MTELREGSCRQSGTSRYAGLKIGAVTYLNSRPLTIGLKRFLPEAEITWDLPSRLADLLEAGQLDVALIPSIEYLRHPEYRVFSDACIACEGPVLSVKLFGRVPVEAVKSVALDEGSRTSAVLVQVLLQERLGRAVETRPLPIGANWEDANADAVLLIGDRAITVPSRSASFVWDLGEEWYRQTGLPFVFSMWVGHEGSSWPELDSRLAAARDFGVGRLEEIARRESTRLGLTEQECLTYLRDHLHFRLGQREQEGLTLFCEKAVQYGYLPAGTTCELSCTTG